MESLVLFPAVSVSAKTGSYSHSTLMMILLYSCSVFERFHFIFTLHMQMCQKGNSNIR